MVNYISYKGDKMGFREKILENKNMKGVKVEKLNRSLQPVADFINDRVSHLKSVLESEPIKERGARRQLKIIKELKATLKSLRKAI
jgi:hypothetical protein